MPVQGTGRDASRRGGVAPDHWVKEGLRAPAYLRFVDDFLILHDEKGVLFEWMERVTEKLGEVRLLPHERKSVVRRTAEGVPFLGYVVFPRRIRVRGETVRRFRRRMGRRARSLAAWRGQVELAGRRLGGLG